MGEKLKLWKALAAGELLAVSLLLHWLFEETISTLAFDWAFGDLARHIGAATGQSPALIMDQIEGLAMPIILAGAVTWVTFRLARRSAGRSPERRAHGDVSFSDLMPRGRFPITASEAGESYDAVRWDDHLGHTYYQKHLTIYTVAVQIGVANISRQEMHLEDAYIISHVTGETVAMKVGTKDTGWVEPNKVANFMPGMKITLRAEFNAPAGMPAQQFFDRWKLAFAVLRHDGEEARTTISEDMVRTLFEHFQPPQIGAGISTAPNIEIVFDKHAPYETTNVEHGHVVSVVRIGLRNSGSGAISNCRVYIDKVVPEPPLPGGLPILLNQEPFLLRHDDPERLVDIASHWDHVDKFRFSAPVSGGFADALSYLPSQPPRTIVVRVEARERQRSATFRLTVDAAKAVHLDFVSYVN